MSEFETEYLKMLRKHAKDTRAFLRNEAKPERERSVCRAFLRAIGVAFEESEVVAPATEPADVDFRTARFQIREVLDPGRKRGDDWKRKEMKYLEATSLDELMEPYSPPTPVTLPILVPEVIKALSEKSRKYGAGCSDIDALVYVNLQDQYLAVHSEMPALDELKRQGWRSVVLLFSPYGVILFAKPTAPDFLVAKEPGQYMEWKDIDSLYESV